RCIRDSDKPVALRHALSVPVISGAFLEENVPRALVRRADIHKGDLIKRDADAPREWTGNVHNGSSICQHIRRGRGTKEIPGRRKHHALLDAREGYDK